MRIRKRLGETLCQWHGPGAEDITEARVLPHDICPWLYHSVYPYFLGLLYGAKFDYNDQGDCHVSCPAAKGVDVVVRKRPNDGTFDPRIGPDMKFVIFAEVVRVKGDCPRGHVVGQKLPFPTAMSEGFMCPAAFNNIFPFLRLSPPPCINANDLRCPDWDNEIHFSVD